MLTMFWRRRANAWLRAFHIHAWSEQPLVTEHGVLDISDHGQGLDLFVSKTLLHVQNWPSRHAELGKPFHPLLGRPRRQPLLDLLRQLLAVLQPHLAVEKPTVIKQLWPLEGV